MAKVWLQCVMLVLGVFLLTGAKDLTEETIECLCTTLECDQMNTRVCNASRLCFTQYLERKDGGSPITKGCIDSASTLLCENRKPEVLDSSLWPVLVCCNEPMCNLHTSPSLPSWDLQPDRQKPVVELESSEREEVNSEDQVNTDSDTELGQKPNSRAEDTYERSEWTSDPVYIAIAIAAVCLIVLLVVLALFVLKQRKLTRYPVPTQAEEECCQATAGGKHIHSGLHKMMHSKECAGDPYICERFFNSV